MSIEREEITKLEARIAKLREALGWIATTQAAAIEYQNVAANALSNDRRKS